MNEFLTKIRQRIPKPAKILARRGLVRYRRHVLAPLRRPFAPHIPIAMITGSNGKTTTTLMLSEILAAAGHTVGTTCTEGIMIGGEWQKRGDCAGYESARTVLRDPRVTAAVLETARGGLIKTGMYVDRCHCAALLNVRSEHIGIDGVDTVEHMARVKQEVINAARDAVILNADDPHCMDLLSDYPRPRVILTSMDESSEELRKHTEAGFRAYVRVSGPDRIERRCGASRTSILDTTEIPAFGTGRYPQNIANALAACALAEGLGIEPDIVRRALSHVSTVPGRLQFNPGYKMQVMVDHAGSPAAFEALVHSIEKIHVPGRRILGFTTGSSREESHTNRVARVIANKFDHFVCYERERYYPKWGPGTINARIKRALIEAGATPESIDETCEREGMTRRVAELAQEGDLVVLILFESWNFLDRIDEFFAQHRTRARWHREKTHDSKP